MGTKLKKLSLYTTWFFPWILFHHIPHKVKYCTISWWLCWSFAKINLEFLTVITVPINNEAKFSPLFRLVLWPRKQIWMCENYVNVKLGCKGQSGGGDKEGGCVWAVSVGGWVVGGIVGWGDRVGGMILQVKVKSGYQGQSGGADKEVGCVWAVSVGSWVIGGSGVRW